MKIKFIWQACLVLAFMLLYSCSDNTTEEIENIERNYLEFEEEVTIRLEGIHALRGNALSREQVHGGLLFDMAEDVEAMEAYITAWTEAYDRAADNPKPFSELFQNDYEKEIITKPQLAFYTPIYAAYEQSVKDGTFTSWAQLSEFWSAAINKAKSACLNSTELDEVLLNLHSQKAKADFYYSKEVKGVNTKECTTQAQIFLCELAAEAAAQAADNEIPQCGGFWLWRIICNQGRNQAINAARNAAYNVCCAPFGSGNNGGGNNGGGTSCDWQQELSNHQGSCSTAMGTLLRDYETCSGNTIFYATLCNGITYKCCR